MSQFNVAVEARDQRGKNAARRLRMAGKIPAVVYGHKESPVAVSVNPKDLSAILQSQSGYNTIFTVTFQETGSTTAAMLKDWQLHPLKGNLLHADLVRIAMDEALQLTIPITAVGEAKGVKLQGGIFEFVLREIEVECLPADIPESIEIDISELEIGANLRVSDLKVDSKIQILSEPELVVAHVIAPKEEKVAEPTEVAAVAEPEVIKKGKVAEEGEAGEAPAKPEEKEKREKEKKEKEKK